MMIMERSHTCSALCSKQPTAKGLLIIIGANQGRYFHPSSKPCSDELIRYISLALFFGHYTRTNNLLRYMYTSTFRCSDVAAAFLSIIIKIKGQEHNDIR